MLEAARAEVSELRQSRTAPLTEGEAKALLGAVDVVVIARGKAKREVPAREVSVDDLRGPTGSIRAPIVRIGRRLLVGFNEEALKAEIGG